MKRIITILLTLITMASTISAQTLDSNWPKGNPNDAYAQYFTGTGPLKTHFSRKPIEETVTYL